MAEESLTFKAFGVDAGAGRMFEHLGDKADDAGDSIRSLGDDSHDLDAHLDETRLHLRALIDDFERTGDKTLFRDIRRDRSTISMLQSMRAELRDLGDDAEAVSHQVSQATSGGFLSGLPGGPLAIGIGAALPIVAALVPTVGAMIGGAVLGGVGTGGVVGGIVAAARDQRVKDAGRALGEHFVEGFTTAGRVFINPLLDQMGTLQHASDVLISDLSSGFSTLAPLVKPLTEGLAGLFENLNLDQAFKDAEPAIRAIAQELPEIGAAIGDALAAIGDESDGATMGLIELLHIVEDITRGTGEFIGAMSALFEWMVRTGTATTDLALDVLDLYEAFTFFNGALANTALDQVRGHIQAMHDDTQSLIDGLDHAKDSGDDWSGSLAGQARSAQEAADAAKQYEDAIRSLFGQLMGLEEAQVRYNLDLIKARVELKEGTKTLAINSEEGLKNRQVLDGLIRDIEAVREAHLANHMPVERANQLYEQQIRQLIELAVKLGFSRKEVERLANALLNIPKTVAPKVEAPGLIPTLNRAIQLDRYFDALDGRNVRTFVSVYDRDYRAGERNPTGRAAGGPVFAGQTYWVGEHGPELVTFGRDGRVIPAAQSAAMSGASGGSVDVNVRLDVTGARDALGQAIVQMLRVDPGFRATVSNYVGGS